MNSQTDRAIDTVLSGLRNASTPAGLEQRIAARLAQAEASAGHHASIFTIILNVAKAPRVLLAPIRIVWSATACATIIALALLASHHHNVSTIADATTSTPLAHTPQALPAATNRVAPPFSVGSLGSLVSRPATNRVLQGSSLGSHGSPLEMEGAPTPDAIALAETLAPSRPAPPLPLTPQEALLLRSARQGQPIEVAELDARRQSLLAEIEDRRERATVLKTVHGLLGPLATAEVLTSPSLSDNTKTIAETTDPLPSK